MNEQLLRSFIREKLILEAKKEKPLTALQRLIQHFPGNHFGRLNDGGSKKTNLVGSGANRITGEAVPDDATLLTKFPTEWLPEVLGKNYHSSKYKTIKLTIPNPTSADPKRTQIRYVVWDDGGASGPAALKNQVIGYVCEWALAAAINGEIWDPTGDLPAGIQGDRRLSKYLDLQPSDRVRKTLDHFAKGAMEVARRAIASDKIQPQLTGPAVVGAGGSAVVDVQTPNADCHVKYNDPIRVIGLQRLPGKSKRNMGDDILDAIASNNPEDFKTLLDTIEKEGLPLPATTAWKFARDEFADKVFGRSLKDLADEKSDPRQEELMLYRKYREDFLKFLEGEEVTVMTTPLKGPEEERTFTSSLGNVRAKLEERLRAFMLTGEEGENQIYFFNFEGEVSPPSEEENAPEHGEVSVGLTVKKIGMKASDVRVVPRGAADGDTSTHLYRIELKGKDAAGTEAWTEIGTIEMRTRGTQMHPPQVKTKKGQEFAEKVVAIPSSAPPEVTTENTMNKKTLLRALIRENLLLEDLAGRSNG